jgi:Protein of unknown function (DUF2510)
MLLARGWHSGSHGGNSSWWSLALLLILAVVMIYLSRRRARRQNSPYGQDSAGSWQQPGTAPGWYPDQYDSSLMRYFDGQNWTSQTRHR